MLICYCNQSTYCSSLYKHCEAIGRTVHIVNLDPAAESFDYPVAVGKFCSKMNRVLSYSISIQIKYRCILADIRELISLEDVMEELGLGPNGGLIYCMEYPFLLFLLVFM